MRVIVEKIDVNDVISLDKVRYNTNNHWNIPLPIPISNEEKEEKEEKETVENNNNGEGEKTNPETTMNGRPSDYFNKLDENKTSIWIDSFKTYSKIEISLNNERWLRDANEIGRHTGRFPNTYSEERDELVVKLNSQFQFQNQNYFVRTENVSLKCGQHGAGPYQSMKEVIESLVTCIDGHTPIQSDMETITLYFIPWITINPASEYRVFICNGHMTAISQQHCYTVYPEYDRIKDVELIYNYFMRKIRPVIPHHSYSIDIAVLDQQQQPQQQEQLQEQGQEQGGEETAAGGEGEDSRVYFIEINCFGKEYAAGSSLFGWLQDEDILYGRRGRGRGRGDGGEGHVPTESDINSQSKVSEGEEDIIYLRYTVRGDVDKEVEEDA